MIVSLPTQPTPEDIERYKYEQNGISYWKTIDLFPYDEENTVWFSDLLASDRETIEGHIQNHAAEIGISAEALRQQFENYLKVNQTPFCILAVDQLSGELKTTFLTSLDALIEQSKPPSEVKGESSKPEATGALEKLLSISKRIAPWIWATVVVVVLIPMIGQWFMVRSLSNDAPQPVMIKTLQPVPNWDLFERLVKDKMRTAHTKTEVVARKELDNWTDQLTERLDNSFLDWYFGYFHQKQLQYTSFFTGISGKFQQWLDPSKPSAQEKIAEEITREFQEEFAKRVLVPQISELELQNIALKTAKTYLRELGEEFNRVPVETGVSAAEWDRYLRETSIAIPSVEGNLIALPLKQITAVGAYVALKPLILPLLPKAGSAVAGKMATKVGAKIAAKTGGTLAAKLGSTFLDATVGVGILLWDVWDINHTANIEKPILRKNLVEYIGEVKESVLENPTNGIMTVTDKIDEKILGAIGFGKDAQESAAGVNS